MLRTVLAATAAVALMFAGCAEANSVSHGQEIAAQAIKAEEDGNFAAAADLFRQALSLRPNHPGLTLRLARASIRAGRLDDAVRALADYAAMGLKADLNRDQIWSGLSSHPEFARLVTQFAENAKPKGTLAVVGTIAEPQVLGEGLAIDTATQRIFVGSVHKRKILALNGGAPSEFVASGRDGLFGAFGMAVDPGRGSLFVASTALPQMAGFAPADKGKAGLFEFALADARLKGRVLVPADGQDHVIGDLALAPSGDVFASNSVSPVIYRLRRGAGTLEEFARSDTFHSLQGLSLSPDGSKLAVADYSAGIHIIDVASGASTVLAMPPHTTLHGIDALMRHGRDLVGVQNGIDPRRVVLLRLNDAWSVVEGLEVLAANLPEMDEPTLATITEGDLLVIGNGQWSRFADDGKIIGDAPFAPTRILRLKLPPARP